MVQIITDSTCAFPPDLEAVLREKVRVLRASVQFGEQTFPEGTLSLDQFYERLQREGAEARTSQPAPDEYLRAYGEAAPHGPILAILLSSELSGTFSAGSVLAKEVAGADVALFDSHFFSSALGYMVAEAAAMAAAGATREAILERLHWRRAHTALFLTVDTVEFLRRSGRVGGLQAVLASAFDIKPIIATQGGKLVPVGRVRSRRRSLERLLTLAEEQARQWDAPFWVSAMHGQAGEEAAWLLAQLERRLPVSRAFTSEIPASIAVHGGPGVIGLMLTPETPSSPSRRSD